MQSAGHGNDSSGTNSEDVAKHAMVMVAGGPLPGLRSYWPAIHRRFKELQFIIKWNIRKWLKARLAQSWAGEEGEAGEG